jgi:multidrug transporter EmrE-like cation transporter
MTVLAAAVALLGSLFFALGAAFQQHEASGSAGPGMLTLLRRPRWLIGTGAVALGGGLHIVALSAGPLIVVQPMGVASLLFALPIAAALHGRRPASSELVAAAVVGAGLAGLVMLIPAAAPAPRMDDASALGLLAAAVLTAIACFGLAKSMGGAGRTALLAVAAGVMYGSCATVTRVIVDGDGGHLWLLAVLPIPVLAALSLLQRAYAGRHFAVAYATLQLTDPLTAVACGALLLGEPLPTNVTAAVVAALVAGAGTVALARTTPLTG